MGPNNLPPDHPITTLALRLRRALRRWCLVYVRNALAHVKRGMLPIMHALDLQTRLLLALLSLASLVSKMDRSAIQPDRTPKKQRMRERSVKMSGSLRSTSNGSAYVGKLRARSLPSGSHPWPKSLTPGLTDRHSSIALPLRVLSACTINCKHFN